MDFLFACVICVIVALFWGIVFALAGLTGWLLLIACSAVFMLSMVVMSMVSVSD